MDCVQVDINSASSFYGVSLISRLQILASPLVCGINPVRIFIRVDFPAPFGPKKPIISPLLISSKTP